MALYAEEIQAISQVLGRECAILAGGIAKLYVSNPSPHAKKRHPQSALNRFPGIRSGKWNGTTLQGCLVFVLDRITDSFHFAMLDPQNFSVMLQYELYFDFEYTELTPEFHCFEMDDLIAGFGFSNRDVAKQFFVKVKVMRPTAKGDSPSQLVKAASGMPASSLRKGSKANKKGGLMSKLLGSEPKGDPMWNEDGTIELKHIPKAWKSLLKKAGFTNKDLKDPSMQTFIVNCLEELGISTSPPPAHVAPEQLAQYYTAEEMASYNAYMEQMRQYEAEKEMYYRQMAEQQAQMEAAAAWEREAAKAMAAYDQGRNLSPTASTSSSSSPSPSSLRKRISFSSSAASSTSSSASSRRLSWKMSSSSAEKKPSRREQERRRQALQASLPKRLQNKPAPPAPPPRPRPSTSSSKPMSRASVRKTRRPELPPLPPLPESFYSEYSEEGPVTPQMLPSRPPQNYPPSQPKPQLERRSLKSRLFSRAPAPTALGFGRSAAPSGATAMRNKAMARPRTNGFLANLRQGASNLKAARQSVLPDLRSIRPDQQSSILEKLRVGLEQRRLRIDDDDDDDDDVEDDDDWSD